MPPTSCNSIPIPTSHCSTPCCTSSSTRGWWTRRSFATARRGTPAGRQRFESLWKTTLDPVPGVTVVEILNAAKKRQLRAMYIMGESPAMSDPDVDHAREALAGLDPLVVQDIFLTETAYLADV